jgi:hypothetical protein
MSSSMDVSPFDRLIVAMSWEHPLFFDVAIGLAMGVAVGLALSSIRDRLS